MKKMIPGFVFLSCSLACSVALAAEPNVSANWVDSGQSLSIQITDTLGSGPNSAGQLWLAMKGDQQSKMIQTSGFQLQCSGMMQPNGTPFAVCGLKLAKQDIFQVGAGYDFAIRDSEGQRALDGFKPIADDLDLSFRPDGGLQIEVNSTVHMLAVWIDQDLISGGANSTRPQSR